MMNEKNISRTKSNFARMYNGENSKRFLVHLVQSFGKLQTIHKLEKTEDSKPCKCNICNKKVVSLEDIRKITSLLPKDEAGTEIKENTELDELNTLPSIKDFKGIKQAFTSTKSNKILCNECISALVQFISDELMKENADMIAITTPLPKRPRKVLNRDKGNVEKREVKQVNQIKKFDKYKNVEHKTHKAKKFRKPNVGLQALSDNKDLLKLKLQLEQNEKSK